MATEKLVKMLNRQRYGKKIVCCFNLLKCELHSPLPFEKNKIKSTIKASDNLSNVNAALKISKIFLIQRLHFKI